MPELPQQKRQRFIADYGLSEYDADILSSDRATATYFETAVKAGADAKLSANWIMGEVAAKLNQTETAISKCAINATQLAGLIQRISDDTISSKIAKQVFEAMWQGQGDADAVIEQQGLKQVSDAGALEKIVDDIMTNNPQQVENYRKADESKRPKMLGFFVGQIMKVTQGQANPKAVNEILLGKLLP
jgi:aspartyl-tRNA(Asn)/glutamyl-tRNA(Gln) amidotransferase subunit B